MQKVKRFVRKILPSPAEQNTLRRQFSLDALGRLEIVDGDVIRHVVPELYEIFKRLESNGQLLRLNDAGLIQTEAWGDEKNCTVRHEFLPYVTYPQEWTLEMLRDGALCTLDIAIELAAGGLRLHEGHPWNISFVNGKPKFLDFSSIEPGCYDAAFVRDFFSGFYVPLWLRSKRQHRLARMINAEDHYLGGPMGARATGRYLFHPRALGRLCWRFNSIGRRLARDEDPAFALKKMRDHIAGMRLPRQKTEWGDYDIPGGSYDDPSSYGAKAKAVLSLLEKVPPGQLIDIAANRGWFAGMASELGHQVLGVDLDERAVDTMRNERSSAFNFDVACMNILWPTPPQGRFLQLASAFDRWQCDTVLMIALSHHLVLRQSITFGALAAIPASLGASSVIIEWIPPDDRHVRTWPKSMGINIPEWYTESNFVEAMSKHYPNHERIASSVRDEDESGKRFLYLFHT